MGRCLLSWCLSLISYSLSPSGTPGYKQGSAVPLLLGKELSWSLLASFHSTTFLHRPMFTPLSAKYFAALETQPIFMFTANAWKVTRNHNHMVEGATVAFICATLLPARATGTGG